ncbi:MAG: hypothetical protein ACE5I4_09080 [Thermoplasmata archaeon]
MSEEDATGAEAGETLSAGTEMIVAAMALLSIFLLSVYADPLGPGGFLVFLPFAALVATYILAFRVLIRRQLARRG